MGIRCFGAVAALASLSWSVDAGAHALDHLKTKDDIGINKIPNAGTSRILVVPAWVGAPFPAAALEAMRAYYAEAGGPGTFRQYWLDMSGGRYDPIPVLVEPVEYPDSCPIPSKTVADCTVSFTDQDIIVNGEVAIALGDVLSRVRDEQNVDLSQFDINGKDGAPDGYFDGVIMQASVAEGVTPPLAALFNETIVATQPGGGGSMLSMGNVALVPPDDHEFGHLFGFIDLYNGPPVNCLMSQEGSLGAYSRQQIGWGEVIDVTPPLQIDLAPTLAGGSILRIGSAPQYLLIENRGGDLHRQYDMSVEGAYVYSIDETKLPDGPLGFLTPELDGLYLPNAEAPYLDVAAPVGCDLYDASSSNRCALAAAGETRALSHPSGAAGTGLTLRVDRVDADGTVRVQIYEGDTVPDFPEPAAEDEEVSGCALSPGSARPLPAVLLMALGLIALRRRR
jgi:MYXO-CTERM domain-containing protein